MTEFFAEIPADAEDPLAELVACLTHRTEADRWQAIEQENGYKVLPARGMTLEAIQIQRIPKDEVAEPDEDWDAFLVMNYRGNKALCFTRVGRDVAFDAELTEATRAEMDKLRRGDGQTGSP